MTDRDLVQKLEKVPLFAGCTKRELAAVANAAKPRVFKAATVIAREGDPGVGLFVILEGMAEVTIGGKKRGTLGPGDFFGEIALIDRGPRSATVTATTEVRAAALTEWTFRGLLQQHPSIAIKTLEVMAGRIRKAEKSADV
ncbi:MAG: cyclic nucleotide-binding domain-containing protein [Actinomycetota bacterium]